MSFFGRLFRGRSEIEEKVIEHNRRQKQIKENPLSSAIVSADTKRLVLEKKILELRKVGLEVTLEQTENIIKNNLHNLEKNDKYKDIITERQDKLIKKIDETNQRLLEISINISTETLVLINSDLFNPLVKIAEKISKYPLEKQNELVIQYAEQLNDFMEEIGEEKENIPRSVIKEAKRSGVCTKLATLVGRTIYFLYNFLTIKNAVSAVSAAFLFKYGLIPHATYGVCFNVPSYFMYGPISGLANLILCLGFSGTMIYRSEGLQRIIKYVIGDRSDIDDIVYTITASSVINSVVGSLLDHNYAFLTDDLPFLARGSLILSSGIELIANFKKNPISTAESITSSLNDISEIAKDYIIAFSTIQKSVSDLIFKIIQTTATEQIKVAGHNVKNMADTAVEIAAQAGETAILTTIDIVASTGSRLKRSVQQITEKVSEVAGKLKGSDVKQLMIESDDTIKDTEKGMIDTMWEFTKFIKSKVEEKVQEFSYKNEDVYYDNYDNYDKSNPSTYIPIEVPPLNQDVVGQLNFKYKKTKKSLRKSRKVSSKASKKYKKSRKKSLRKSRKISSKRFKKYKISRKKSLRKSRNVRK
jgi:acylphosphatase